MLKLLETFLGKFKVFKSLLRNVSEEIFKKLPGKNEGKTVEELQEISDRIFY